MVDPCPHCYGTGCEGVRDCLFCDGTGTRTPATQANDAELVDAIRDQLCCGASSCAKAALAAILPILHRREQARYFEGLDTGSSQGYDEGRAAERTEAFARHRIEARRKALEDAAERLTKQGYTMSPESIRAMIEGEG